MKEHRLAPCSAILKGLVLACILTTTLMWFPTAIANISVGATTTVSTSTTSSGKIIPSIDCPRCWAYEGTFEFHLLSEIHII